MCASSQIKHRQVAASPGIATVFPPTSPDPMLSGVTDLEYHTHTHDTHRVRYADADMHFTRARYTRRCYHHHMLLLVLVRMQAGSSSSSAPPPMCHKFRSDYTLFMPHVRRASAIITLVRPCAAATHTHNKNTVGRPARARAWPGLRVRVWEAKLARWPTFLMQPSWHCSWRMDDDCGDSSE